MRDLRNAFMESLMRLLIVLFFGSPVLLLTWQTYIYLKTGVWDWVSLSDMGLFSDIQDTSWVGLNSIKDWLINKAWPPVLIMVVTLAYMPIYESVED